jgi:hypothetical protein
MMVSNHLPQQLPGARAKLRKSMWVLGVLLVRHTLSSFLKQNFQLIHPHIPVLVLQKVAQEVCGIPPPPTEVSTEVLLEAPNSEEESSNKLHIVPYGFF